MFHILLHFIEHALGSQVSNKSSLLKGCNIGISFKEILLLVLIAYILTTLTSTFHKHGNVVAACWAWRAIEISNFWSVLAGGLEIDDL